MANESANLESPFLDGEIRQATEPDADWQPRVARLVNESPFGRVFEHNRSASIEPEDLKEEFALGDDSPSYDSEGESPLDALSPSELKAVRITSTFETGRTGSFGGLTGNFDGQGVSFGLMNFAWKAGSLITLLKEFLRDHSVAFAEVFGSDAGRFQEIVLATKPNPNNPKLRVRDNDSQMNFARNVLNDPKNKIREPWRSYFRRLEINTEFRRIQVRAVRKATERARYWCDYFELTTERAFAFMFDLVTSHGPAWLNARKFKERRRRRLRAMLEKKMTEVGRAELTELEKMEVIANMIADVSSEKWRERVRERKLWFVKGSGKVQGSLWDLAKDFGVTDAPPDFGTSEALQHGAELTKPSDEWAQEEPEDLLRNPDETRYEEALEEAEDLFLDVNVADAAEVIETYEAQPFTESFDPEPSVLPYSRQAGVSSGLRQRIVDRAKAEWVKWDHGQKNITQARDLLCEYWMNYQPKPHSQAWVDNMIDGIQPWSAVFISYVMRYAGAGDAFTYDTYHSTYIAAAKEAASIHNSSGFQAYEISTVKPELGDVLCRDRPSKLGFDCAGTTFANVVSGKDSHGDIVVEVCPNYIVTLGGNTSQSYPIRGRKFTVGQHKVLLDKQGFVIPDQQKCKFFAIVKPPQAGGIVSLFTALGSLVTKFRELITSGQERLAIALAYKQGITDENKLTNLVFFARHPELGGRQLLPSERQLAREWLDIRNQLVTQVIPAHEIANENIYSDSLIGGSGEYETEGGNHLFHGEEYLDEESSADLAEGMEESYDEENGWETQSEIDDENADFEDSQSLEEESPYEQEEPSLDKEFFLESLLRLFNPGTIVQQAQLLLSNGALSLALLGRFITGKIWNEDYLALEILYRRKPQLRPINLDNLTDAKRLSLLRSQAVKHRRELISIRENIVRPIFGNPHNFQIRPATGCEIQDLRGQVQALGDLVAGKYKGQTYYKKDKSHSPRKWENIDSIVLHHMAFNRGNNVNSYHEVGAHYIVTADGQIAQLYDDLDFLNASNGFNPRSIAIEFAGNFPDDKYGWWKKPNSLIPDRCYLTPAQIYAGRCLLVTLKDRFPAINYLYAHRQSSNKGKDNDPGPDVWFNIGEWALTQLNLTDRLPQPYIGKGKAIPDLWRSPRSATARATP